MIFMQERSFICIGCPMGCSLTVRGSGEGIEVSGNQCKIGKDYAVKEVTDPRRTMCSSVRVNNGAHVLVSVKTKEPVPKELVRKCAESLKPVVVNAPVKIGDILVKDICGTGIDIVATRNVEGVI